MIFFSSVYLPMEMMRSSSILGGNVGGLVIMGNPSISSGYHGNSIHLDGVSAVSFGSARNGCFLSMDLCPDGFTISLWIFDPGTKTDNTYYVSSGGQTASSYGFALLQKPTHHLAVVKTKSYWYSNEFQISTQKWTHVVVTWYDDPANPMDAFHVYVDSIHVASGTVLDQSFPGASNHNLITVGSPNNGNNTQYFLQASIDELLFWDMWKGASFVSEIYNYYEG